jgi:hypothetical protein
VFSFVLFGERRRRSGAKPLESRDSSHQPIVEKALFGGMAATVELRGREKEL